MSIEIVGGRIRCMECKAYTLNEELKHAPECSLWPDRDEQIKALIQRLTFYKGVAANQSRSISSLIEKITFWQGKFAIVKHENNVLRRKLRNVVAKGEPIA